MESDSGISVNLSHFDSGTVRRGGEVEVGEVGRGGEEAPPPPSKPPPINLSSAIRAQFEEEFCNW